MKISELYIYCSINISNTNPIKYITIKYDNFTMNTLNADMYVLTGTKCHWWKRVWSGLWPGVTVLEQAVHAGETKPSSFPLSLALRLHWRGFRLSPYEQSRVTREEGSLSKLH